MKRVNAWSNDEWYYTSFILVSRFITMKKLLLTILLLGSILPSVEAGVSPEGIPRRRRPGCRTHGEIVVCKMPRKKRCTIQRPCIPRGYYRNNPVPLMPLR